MKLMICGKGGSGKSTIVSLLARQYAAEGKRVVVVDTDVSNRGLHRLLGMDAPPDFAGDFTDQKSMREAVRKTRQSAISRGKPLTDADAPPGSAAGNMNDKRSMRETFRKARHEDGTRGMPRMGMWTYETLPEKFCTSANNVKLVAMGKIHEPTDCGKGRWVGITRQFIAGYQMKAPDRVIIDTDAGVEHLARGMGGFCDAILVVVDISNESILLAKSVARMMETTNMPVYFVLNKTDGKTSQILRKILPNTFRVIGEFPHDMKIFDAGFRGEVLNGGSPAAKEILNAVETFHSAGMT